MFLLNASIPNAKNTNILFTSGFYKNKNDNLCTCHLPKTTNNQNTQGKN